MTGRHENHVENERITGRRLGRRPNDPNRPLLHLKDILTGTIPDHPATAEHFSRVGDWGLYGNDKFGDCGPTSVANARKLTTKYLGVAEASPSQDDVFDLYRRSGNPNFDPNTDSDDNGVDMATMLSAVLAGGIAGIKGVAYASVDVTNPAEVDAALAIFGYLLLGIDLKVAQQAQTNAGLWDYKRSSDWGGHAVLCGTYTGATKGDDRDVITWAQRVGTTDAFWTHQVQEAYVLIWPEHLGTTQFQQGIDMAALNAAYQALTGHTLPTPTPVPAPTPTPVGNADAALATAARTWLTSKGL